MMNTQSFSGSYKTGQVEFLLRPLVMTMTNIKEKEQLIQSGQRHYSEMLSQEPEPSPRHLHIFHAALEAGGERLALESVKLAKAIHQQLGDQPIILVSLVRAGVPLGVILHETLRDLGVESHHYGISIIRDRGIDHAALDIIEARHGTAGIVFVDGWTGKGAITGELKRTLAGRPGYPVMPRLAVLADPCGCSWLSASGDDWLIPFGILGAPVSGLVSRSVWTEQGLHGCVLCDHLAEYECSQLVADVATAHRQRLNLEDIEACVWAREYAESLAQASARVIDDLANKYAISNRNRIKPGIAEATRAVLRRVPDHVLVRSMSDPDVSLLVHLAKETGIIITEVGDALGPYRAVTIIKKVS